MIALTHTDLPEPVAPAINRCGIRVRSATTGSPDTSRPKATASGEPTLAKSLDSRMLRRLTIVLAALGTSMPTYGRPGTGASMRSEGAASASARSLFRRRMLDTVTRRRSTSPLRISRTSSPGSTPNCVTVGPSLILTTSTGTPNSARVCLMSCDRCRASELAAALACSSRSSAIGGSQSGRVDDGAPPACRSEDRSWPLGSLDPLGGLPAATGAGAGCLGGA